MEAAICTRCQSTNPIFTKFCLTCGLAITPEMKRVMPVSAGAPAAIGAAPVSTVGNMPEAAPSAASSANPPEQQPQKEGSSWLKGWRRKGR